MQIEIRAIQGEDEPYRCNFLKEQPKQKFKNKSTRIIQLT